MRTFLAEAHRHSAPPPGQVRQAVIVDGYGPETYGESFSDVYDEWYPTLGDDQGAIDTLARLAGDPNEGGSLLELGVGTGRLAIPLAALGFDVWGLDASPAMLDRLRDKAGGARVKTVTADMAVLDGTRPAGLGDRRFRLVFASFNTFLNLTSHADQARCLNGAARRLTPDGRLVIEAFVPAESTRSSAGVIEVGRITTDRVVLTVSRARPDDQVVDGHHIELSSAGTRLRPWSIRYLTPDQLDDMAADAGLTLTDRWAGWRGDRFDATSSAHVSVYALPDRSPAER
jgi:SAM-dependent methyltransferase